jgi:prephenate dehydratase
MITAAYQGMDGAYSDVLLRQHFGARGEELETLGLPTFRDVAVALLAGRARYGVLPLENTLTGTFRVGYDLVAQYDLVPVRDIVFRMDHRLVGVPGATLAGLERIEAHPIVL